MNAAAIRRLIWKDARAIGPVWIALLAVVAMLQLIIVAAAWLDPAGWRWEGRSALWGTLAMVCMPLGFCLAAAVAGILFAGESEERTDEWLQVLPIPPRTLAAAKLGAGLLAVVAFIAAGQATASPWTWIDLRVMNRSWAVRRADAAAVIGMILLAGLPAFATGVFLSVQMRRVIAVVAGTLIGALPLFGIADWFANDVLRIPNDLGAPLLFTALGLLDVWLVMRWCRGETVFAVGLARRAARLWRLDLGTGTTSKLDGERLDGERPVRRQTASLAVLQRGAALGSPGARSLAVLFWKEARSAAPFALAWAAAGVVFLVPTLLDATGRNSSRGFPIALVWLLAAIYWSVTPGLFGVLAAGERRRDQQLFLCDRGASPTAVWLAKQATWLTLACLLTIGWTWTQHTLAGPDGKQLLLMLEGVFAPRLVGTGRGHWWDTPTDLALRTEVAAMLLLGLYTVGQLCGFWFRNAIVALGMTVFLSIPLGVWLLLAVAADVPPSLAVGPFILLWLMGTWRLMDDWLCGRTGGGRRVWRRIAWTFLPALVAVTAFVHHRRTQIPLVEASHARLDSRTDRAALRAESQRIAGLSAAEPARDLPPAPEWAVLKDRLEAFVRASGPSDEALAVSGWSDGDLRRLDADFAAFAEQVRSAGFAMPPSAPLPTTIGWPLSVSNYATNRGEALRAAGDRLSEWQLYLDALAILREVRNLPPIDDAPALQARVEIFRLMARWAQADDVTVEELRRVRRSGAFRRETEFTHWLPPEAYVDDFAKLIDRFYEEGPLDAEALNANLHAWPSFYPWAWRVVRAADRWMGERERVERFLNVCRANAESIAVWNWRPEPPRRSVPAVSRDEIERWAATTGPLRWAGASGRYTQSASDLLGMIEALALQGQTELACERGVRLVIALERFRRERGEYPRSLAELVPEFLPFLPVDPFTGGEFEYLPDGLDRPWLLDARRVYSATDWAVVERPTVVDAASRLEGYVDPLGKLRVIAARQPLLFSRGPYSGGYVFRPYPVHRWTTDAAGRHQPTGLYREVVSGAIDGGGPSGVQPPGLADLATARAAPDAPVTFVVLGREFIPW